MFRMVALQSLLWWPLYPNEGLMLEMSAFQNFAWQFNCLYQLPVGCQILRVSPGLESDLNLSTSVSAVEHVNTNEQMKIHYISPESDDCFFLRFVFGCRPLLSSWSFLFPGFWFALRQGIWKLICQIKTFATILLISTGNNLCDGLASHLGGVEILVVVWPDGPLGLKKKNLKPLFQHSHMENYQNQ